MLQGSPINRVNIEDNWLGQLGIKREVFVAGKYKAEGVGGTGLTAEARVHITALIDGAYSRMIGDIAKGRGVTARDVRGGFGEGRLVDVDAAKEAGLIDRIGTLQDTVTRAATTRGPRALDTPPAATDQEPPLAAATSKERPAVPDNNDATIALAEYEQRLLALVKGN